MMQLSISFTRPPLLRFRKRYVDGLRVSVAADLPYRQAAAHAIPSTLPLPDVQSPDRQHAAPRAETGQSRAQLRRAFMRIPEIGAVADQGMLNIEARCTRI